MFIVEIWYKVASAITKFYELQQVKTDLNQFRLAFFLIIIE